MFMSVLRLYPAPRSDKISLLGEAPAELPAVTEPSAGALAISVAVLDCCPALAMTLSASARLSTVIFAL